MFGDKQTVEFASIIFVILLIYAGAVVANWEFAITAKTKIVFYNEHWQEVVTSAHQFDQLAALAFDETEDIIYFNDKENTNTSIFSLKIPFDQTEPHIIQKIVPWKQTEFISSIAYDPLSRNIFWADKFNRKIYFTPIEARREKNDTGMIFLDFVNAQTIPDGITIDICNRRLYWTNSNFKNASIERIDLNGSNRELLINDNLYLPHGIIVCQLSNRIYWVDDQQGMHYRVESANLDGSDRRIIVQGFDSTPYNLAVNNDFVFWTDRTHNAIWMYWKRPNIFRKGNHTYIDYITELSKPRKIVKFTEEPKDIVARTRFLTNLQNSPQCASVVSQIKQHLLVTEKSTKNQSSIITKKLQFEYCLNDGEYIPKSNICICQMGYIGRRCEMSECHNYCVHGTCRKSTMGFPACTCQRGFQGERCQSFKCSNFCFNDGTCRINTNGEPYCECLDNFSGSRCEQNLTEICSLFCRVLKYESNIPLPVDCYDICQELAAGGEDAARRYALPTYKNLEICQNQVPWTNTLITVLVVGVIFCLMLVLLIVIGVRRFYKPVRPIIKKTFVVRKQAVSPDTPLTNSPVATEQCEITIENCCNMNYCDTPCFDPKLVQQTLSREGNTKDDKKMLIHHMEDDLY